MLTLEGDESVEVKVREDFSRREAATLAGRGANITCLWYSRKWCAAFLWEEKETL